MSTIHEGDTVYWKWGNGVAEGKVETVAHERIEIETKGKTIARNGSGDNPAIVIIQDNGTKVLKLSSEVKKD